METTPKEIAYYATDAGKLPFREWYMGLRDHGAKAIISQRLDRVSLGLMGDWKFLSDGVYELRVNYGPGYRIYFGQDGQKLVLLLCGGDKKSQDRDIKTAKKYWENYQTQKRSKQ